MYSLETEIELAKLLVYALDENKPDFLKWVNKGFFNDLSFIFRCTNEMINSDEYIEVLKDKKKVLSVIASGDQILNAESYKKQGFSTVLQEEELTSDILINAVKDVYDRRDSIEETMASSHLLDANSTILKLITDINK